MRQFLVTKMVCAACGSNLELSYTVPKNAGAYAEGEPTGARMVQQLIAVVPCRKCLQPVEDVRAAARVLLSVAGAV